MGAQTFSIVIRVHRMAKFAQSTILCFQNLGFHDHTFNRAKSANYVISPGFHGQACHGQATDFSCPGFHDKQQNSLPMHGNGVKIREYRGQCPILHPRNMRENCDVNCSIVFTSLYRTCTRFQFYPQQHGLSSSLCAELVKSFLSRQFSN